MRNFLWCYYRRFIASKALEKFKKECNILYINLAQCFCPLKIKITQFPGGFHRKLSVCLCRNPFSSVVHFIYERKKTFILKPRKTCNKTLSFQELVVACTAAGCLFAVCRVVFSFVVCKVRDVSQTHQTKPPASLRRLKNLLITNFVLFH